MSIQVNDFRWEPGENDAEYIRLLESARDEWQKIAQKAVAKLKTLSKAQEPRVMTLAELDDLCGRGRAVWFEDRDAFAKCQDVFFAAASDIHAYFKGETYSMLKMIDGYGRSWRCWTSRPTDEQRKAVKWDD